MNGFWSTALVSLLASAMALAQQLPSALTSDPPPDRQYPAAMVGLTVPSHGQEMNGALYLAAGAGPHPTVLLLHGLPGYESSADLTQTIRRAGWNVLWFDYRGSWGTPGSFSFASALEDATAAVQFLQSPATVKQYRIDPQRIVLIGHSFGGFVAGYEAARNRRVAGVAMISAVNLGTISSNPKEGKMRLLRWQGQMRPLAGCTAEGLFAEAREHSKDWDYVGWAPALRDRSILIIAADDQNRADNEALAAALRKQGAGALENLAMSTDHSFSDHRIALQVALLRWLARVKAGYELAP